MLKKILRLAVIGLLILGVIIFVIRSLWIGSDVRNFCNQAQKIYGGDCIEASISILDNKSLSYEARNQAIWILGQLGDSRATPYLNKYYTGKTDSDTSKTKGISQKELDKALRLTTGATNLSALIWRHNIP